MNEAASLTSLIELLVRPGVAPAREPDREHVVRVEEVHAVIDPAEENLGRLRGQGIHEGVLIDVLHLDRDAQVVTQHARDSLRHRPGQRVRVSHLQHLRWKARPVGKAGARQQLLCLCRIEILNAGELLAVRGREPRRQPGVGGHARRSQDLLLDRIAVDGVTERLPHLEGVERRLRHIEEEVVRPEVADRGVDLRPGTRPVPPADRPGPGPP